MNREVLSAAAGYDVSRETYDALMGFHREFTDWSKRINLVAPSTENEFWQRHVADSLQLLSIKPAAKSWVDLGSGGGFPGMIIAIALDTLDDSRVTLVESNRKKCAFLQMARSKFAPRTTVVPSRIEDAASAIRPPDVVTARALADLSKLLSLSQSWLRNGAVGLFPKGRGYAQEIENS
ncbi:MAG: 16S rRNA (guanine(527)-N(7))-methyltransferase RsmG, partial [Pseudomonadota bacterium]